MATLVNQTNVNKDRAFFLPAAGTGVTIPSVGAGPDVTISSVTFNGAIGTVSTGTAGLILGNFGTNLSTLQLVGSVDAGNEPFNIAVNSLYLPGAQIISPSSTVISVLCPGGLASDFISTGNVVVSSINGTIPVRNPLNQKFSLPFANVQLDSAGQYTYNVFIPPGQPSTLSAVVTACQAAPTIFPIASTIAVSTVQIIGEPLAFVNILTISG